MNNKVRGARPRCTVIKHEAKPSALLASRPSAEYFIFHIARARLCFK